MIGANLPTRPDEDAVALRLNHLAIGAGRRYPEAERFAEKALAIAAKICIYTNDTVVVEDL